MAVILAITILGTGLIGSYTTVPAAEFSAGAIAAGETLEWITAVLAGAGISISVKELLKPRQAEIEKDIGKHIDWDNYDWGDALDSPAAQDQIDELDKTINKLYGNASAKWKEMYEKSLSPTPTPETSPDKPDPSPPVTVAPIDPDKVTPPGWDTLRKASMKNGYLALGAATYWCLKEAVKGLWDNWMDNTPPTTKLNGNPLAANSKDLVGRVNITYQTSRRSGVHHFYFYNTFKYNDLAFYINDVNENNMQFMDVRTSTLKQDGSIRQPYQSESRNVDYYMYETRSDNTSDELFECSDSFYTDISAYAGLKSVSYDYQFYVPYYWKGKVHNADAKPVTKEEIWVHPDLQDTYKNNGKLEYPQQAPQPLQIPSISQLTDLANKLKTNPQQSPNSVQELIDQLKQNPQPQPTVAPNPNPNPDPNPDPEVTPKPDDTTTDVNPDDYKADLRLVFPFCIPFDLVHLIQAFEAEPEAPVFEFPLDLELENPWTGKKILDYHHVFKLDMSDYEPVIKIFRIFEIIFFIIGLLMITRQQMIKG